MVKIENVDRVRSKKSCCELKKEETKGPKKYVKKVFNFFYGCCKK